MKTVGEMAQYKHQLKNYESIQVTVWAEDDVAPNESAEEAEQRVWDFVSGHLVERVQEAKDALK